MKENLQNNFQSVEIEKLKISLKFEKENIEKLKKQEKYLLDKESQRLKEDFEQRTYEMRRKLEEKENECKKLSEEESKKQILIEKANTLKEQYEQLENENKESKEIIAMHKKIENNLKKELNDANLKKSDLGERISEKNKTIANLLVERSKDKENINSLEKQTSLLLELKEEIKRLNQEKEVSRNTVEDLKQKQSIEKSNFSTELKKQSELYYRLMKELEKKDRVIEKFLPMFNEIMKKQICDS